MQNKEINRKTMNNILIKRYPIYQRFKQLKFSTQLPKTLSTVFTTPEILRILL